MVRDGSGSRGAGRGALERERLSPPSLSPPAFSPVGDTLLRPALEAALAVARAGDEATPIEPPPPALRPFLHFAKLPRPALVAARRVLDADDEFRARVLESVSESDIGRSGWIYLARPDGWEDELAALLADAENAGAAAGEKRAEGDARKRLAGAEAARRRAEDAAAAAEVEATRAVAALADERKARRAAADDVARLERRLAQVSVERDRAKEAASKAAAESEEGGRLVAELRFALDQSQLAELAAVEDAAAAAEAAEEAAAAALLAPTVAGPAEPSSLPIDTAGAAAALDEAATAAAALAQALAGVAASLRPPGEGMGKEASVGGPGGVAAATTAAATAPAAGGGPASPPAARGPRALRRVRPPVPQPVPLPPGIYDDSLEAAEHLVRVPGMVLLVDGYNVSLLGWPELPIAEQRPRLVDALAELSARSGVEVAVVFDGTDTPYPGVVPATARPVRVQFSPPNVEADDVLISRVAELRPFRPVVVASSDRRVQAGSRLSGANVISSSQLLAVLHR